MRQKGITETGITHLAEQPQGEVGGMGMIGVPPAGLNPHWLSLKQDGLQALSD